MNKIYRKGVIPKKKSQYLSEYVLTIDKKGMMEIAYYNFHSKRWNLLNSVSDTAKFNEKRFRWMYIPEEFKKTYNAV